MSPPSADPSLRDVVGVASASSHLIGWWLPRQRPAADHLPAYQALIQKPTSSSFPSSHAATAAAFTTAIARESPAAGLVVAPVAVAVAHSRLRTRAHWPSDVVAGTLWGIAVGVATRRLLTTTRRRRWHPGRPVFPGICTVTVHRRVVAVFRGRVGRYPR